MCIYTHTHTECRSNKNISEGQFLISVKQPGQMESPYTGDGMGENSKSSRRVKWVCVLKQEEKRTVSPSE